MKLQVLISTMHQKDYSLLGKMNIQSDAIIVNQCEKNCVEEFEYNGFHIKWVSSNERGVGKSRNTALLKSSADILLFADDDVVYEEGYANRIINFFESNPRVDVATFNLKSLNEKRPLYLVSKTYRLHRFNCLRFGACRIAVRREAVLKNNIWFSLLFGGGAPFQAGEDNLFLTNCIQKKMNSVASTIFLGTVKQEDSTWFKGYDEKYFFDRGALFAAMYGHCAYAMLVLFELKKVVSKNSMRFHKRLKTGLKGVRMFKKKF